MRIFPHVQTAPYGTVLLCLLYLNPSINCQVLLILECRWDPSKWFEHRTANADVATFDPSILRHSEIWGAANEANKVTVPHLASIRDKFYFVVLGRLNPELGRGKNACWKKTEYGQKGNGTVYTGTLRKEMKLQGMFQKCHFGTGNHFFGMLVHNAVSLHRVCYTDVEQLPVPTYAPVRHYFVR